MQVIFSIQGNRVLNGNITQKGDFRIIDGEHFHKSQLLLRSSKGWAVVSGGIVSSFNDVKSASFDETTGMWKIVTDDGETVLIKQAEGVTVSVVEDAGAADTAPAKKRGRKAAVVEEPEDDESDEDDTDEDDTDEDEDEEPAPKRGKKAAPVKRGKKVEEPEDDEDEDDEDDTDDEDEDEDDEDEEPAPKRGKKAAPAKRGRKAAVVEEPEDDESDEDDTDDEDEDEEPAPKRGKKAAASAPKRGKKAAIVEDEDDEDDTDDEDEDDEPAPKRGKKPAKKIAAADVDDFDWGDEE